MLEILLGILLSILTGLGLSDAAPGTCSALSGDQSASMQPCPPPDNTTDTDEGNGLIKVGGAGLIKVGGSG